MNNKFEQKAIQILKENHYRLTKGKVEILLALLKADKPIRIEDIAKNLNVKLDIVTIYRAVNGFSGKGIIKKINLGDMAAYYEIHHAEHHHHHIICNICGLFEDIEDCHAINLEKKTLQISKSFETINSHSLEFFGLCKKCMINKK